MHRRTFTQRRTYGDMWLRDDGDSRGSASVALPCLENVPMVLVTGLNPLDVARSRSASVHHSSRALNSVLELNSRRRPANTTFSSFSSSLILLTP